MKNILVVDDESEILTLIQQILGMKGFTTHLVSSVEGACAALRLQRFDAVLTDFELPDGDGLEVLEICRRMQPAAKVLVLTGNREEEVGRQILTAKPDGFLAKPFTMTDLILSVAQLLK